MLSIPAQEPTLTCFLLRCAGGQLWYLQSRILKAIEEGRPIFGSPMNQAARDSGYAFDPEARESTPDDADLAKKVGDMRYVFGHFEKIKKSDQCAFPASLLVSRNVS